MEDHCRALAMGLEGGREGQVYNIGAGNTEPNLAIVRRILRALGKPERLMTRVADRPGHDRRYALDCSKLQRELGWSADMDLDRGIQQTIDWYRANAVWLQHVRSGDYQQYYDKYYTNRDKSLKAVTA